MTLLNCIIITRLNKLYSLLSKSDYDYKSWGEKFPDNVVSLSNLYIHADWNAFFKKAKKNPSFKKLEEFLSHCLDVTSGKVKIYPYPELVFSAFNATPLKKLNVVILGQDPYHQNEQINDNIVPQAMGMSFSVPVGMKTPSSLVNIYKNLHKYGHISQIPSHGNLESWAYQGVLMINASLTVQHGYANGHANYWTWLTDQLITYISNNTENMVFVLWGGPAYSKRKFIDQNKHLIIASSHPSGLSCYSKMGDKPAFADQDHFKMINDHLKKHKKQSIVWEL